jgi:hypothetical protein
MQPLNPTLYRALLREFGKVLVADEGAEMVATYHRDPDGRTRMSVVSAGEYYRINCPFCVDLRFRLWINHRWGVRDPRTGTRNRWLAICFNENCLASEENRLDLIERTSWYQRGAGAGRVAVLAGRVVDAGQRIALPRDFVPLDQLPKDHPARRYVRGRGFDPDRLARLWGVGFSEREAFCLSSVGRLVIPVYKPHEGKFVCWGWQARAVVEEQWGRYFTAPGLKKSHLLYGLERAVKGAGPVLVCEGATDVWRAGGNAVALLGHYASEEQVCLLRKYFPGRPLAVALDPDAHADARALVEKLRSARAGSLLNPDGAPVALVPLLAGKDPGDCGHKELWALAERALRRAGPSGPGKQRRAR